MMFADILILAAIAGFIYLRLKDTLGKQTGFDPRNKPTPPSARGIMRDSTIIDLKAEDATPPKETLDYLPTSSVLGVEMIRLIEPQFRVEDFIKGATSAYEMVFSAYEKGDKTTLKMLLETPVFVAFINELDLANSGSDTTAHTSLVSVKETTVRDVTVEGKKAQITVLFTSEQMTVIKDKEGKTVRTQGPEKAEDEWVFERELGQKNPNWKITAT